ncbi:hypothetical protein KI387_001428, partial [Taxus chinensis]
AEADHQPRLLTIDFMGIGSDKLETSNSSSTSCCHQQLTTRRSMQWCLRKIKPHMLQQVLFPNPEVEISEPIIETLELFPLHTSNCKEGDIVDRQSPSITARIKFSELAAPFYNDAPNVSSEKAGKNGNGNGLQQIYRPSEMGVSSPVQRKGQNSQPRSVSRHHVTDFQYRRSYLFNVFSKSGRTELTNYFPTRRNQVKLHKIGEPKKGFADLHSNCECGVLD